MLDKIKSLEIARKRLFEIQKNCPVDIAFHEELIEETELGFVFYYNSKMFWETRDFAHSLAGNGPLLVLKESGEVIDLPSNQSVKRSIREMVKS